MRENYILNLRNALLKMIPESFTQITMGKIHRIVGAVRVSNIYRGHNLYKFRCI